MQKICSVNELKGHFYVQTTFRVTRTRPPATGRIMIFIYKEPPINSALFSCWTGPLGRPHPPGRPASSTHPPAHPSIHPSRCIPACQHTVPTGHSPLLTCWKTWSELESDPPAPPSTTPPHTFKLEEGQPAALLKWKRINGGQKKRQKHKCGFPIARFSWRAGMEEKCSPSPRQFIESTPPPTICWCDGLFICQCATLHVISSSHAFNLREASSERGRFCARQQLFTLYINLKKQNRKHNYISITQNPILQSIIHYAWTPRPSTRRSQWLVTFTLFYAILFFCK